MSFTNRILRIAASSAALLGLCLTGCGSGSKSTSQPPTPPSITSQPSNQTVSSGQTATFSVGASGTAPLSYQWKKGSSAISGANSSSYTTPATTSGDDGSQFSVTVSNSAGTATSNPATLTVNTPPSITTQPANQTVTAGQTASFSVVASGTGTLSYQWQKGGSNISGATSASYTTPATTASDNGSQFTVVVSDAGGNVTSDPATLTVDSPPSITTQPANQTVVAGQTATFTVAAAGTAPLSYQWQKASASISGATSSSYTTPATTLTDNGTQFDVVVSNSLGNITSNAVTLTVTATAPAVDVLTYQYDNTRAGANVQELALTPSNVNFATFGKIGFYSVDGLVDAQPLYVSNLVIPAGGTHNVVYVVTEHDSVYAFDADAGTILWQTSLLGTNETTSDARGCNQVSPEIGITSTPVIDRTRGAHGAIYIVAMSKDASGNYHQRLHALDIVTGAELFGGPVVVAASYPGTGDGSTGGNVIFDAKQYKERAGLLLLNGVVYTTWASHCDIRPYTGWIIGYDESSLVRTQVLNVTPNGYDGAIWMAGAAPAADVTGNIYFLDGNGTFDTALNVNGFPSQGDFGNAFIKLSTSPTLSVSDYFTMSDTVSESSQDHDLGSGGAMVLADITYSGQTHQLAVGAGKDQVIYVVDRTAMGGFNSSADNIYQEISGALNGGVFSKAAFFNNTIYYGAVGDVIRAFPITGAKLATTAAFQTSNTFKYPGTTPSISANGSSNAIVWAVENTSTAVLHAYNASTLAELYNSTQAANQRDDFGAGNKFIVPIIVNGKVFVGTPNGVAVFGLLP